MKRLKEIEARKLEIRNLLEGSGDVDLSALEIELKSLDSEKTNIEKRSEMLEMVKAGQTETIKIEKEEKMFAEPRLEKKSKPFNNFGEQMLAIVRSSTPGAQIDKRLLEVRASGSSEGVPSDGGFLVQTDFSSEIIRNIFETGSLAQKCRRIPISANSNGIKINGIDESSRVTGSRWGGVRGYWADEAATVSASSPKFRKIELTLNKLMAIYYSTDELLQDAAAMESILSQAFTEELQFLLDDAIVRGTGSGQPLGILNAGALVTQDKETGQAADTIIFENILHMWSRLISTSRANAVWLINQEIEPQLHSMVLSAGVSAVPVYMPAGGISGSQYSTLYGKPVMPIEQASAIGDLGDIMLVDMGQYLLADKAGLQTASSMHVKFVYDEMAFRVTYRVDGQPIMHSAITPYKGTKSLSSFVTLQAR